MEHQARKLPQLKFSEVITKESYNQFAQNLTDDLLFQAFADEGWIPFDEMDGPIKRFRGFKAHFHNRDPETGDYGFRMKCVFRLVGDCTIKDVLALMWSLRRWKEWNPAVLNAYPMEEFDVTSQVLHCAFGHPIRILNIDDRDFTLFRCHRKVHGKKGDTHVIAMRSVDHPDSLETNTCTRGHMFTSGFVIKERGPASDLNRSDSFMQGLLGSAVQSDNDDEYEKKKRAGILKFKKKKNKNQFDVCMVTQVLVRGTIPKVFLDPMLVSYTTEAAERLMKRVARKNIVGKAAAEFGSMRSMFEAGVMTETTAEYLGINDDVEGEEPRIEKDTRQLKTWLREGSRKERKAPTAIAQAVLEVEDTSTVAETIHTLSDPLLHVPDPMGVKPPEREGRDSEWVDKYFDGGDELKLHDGDEEGDDDEDEHLGLKKRQLERRKSLIDRMMAKELAADPTNLRPYRSKKENQWVRGFFGVDQSAGPSVSLRNLTKTGSTLRGIFEASKRGEHDDDSGDEDGKGDGDARRNRARGRDTGTSSSTFMLKRLGTVSSKYGSLDMGDDDDDGDDRDGDSAIKDAEKRLREGKLGPVPFSNDDSDSDDGESNISERARRRRAAGGRSSGLAMMRLGTVDSRVMGKLVEESNTLNTSVPTQRQSGAVITRGAVTDDSEDDGGREDSESGAESEGSRGRRRRRRANTGRATMMMKRLGTMTPAAMTSAALAGDKGEAGGGSGGGADQAREERKRAWMQALRGDDGDDDEELEENSRQTRESVLRNSLPTINWSAMPANGGASQGSGSGEGSWANKTFAGSDGAGAGTGGSGAGSWVDRSFAGKDGSGATQEWVNNKLDGQGEQGSDSTWAEGSGESGSKLSEDERKQALASFMSKQRSLKDLVGSTQMRFAAGMAKAVKQNAEE